MSEHTESTELQLLEAAILARHRLASDALATLRTEAIAKSVDEIPALMNALRYGRELDAERLARISLLQRALAFAQSVIKSGESWSPTCDEIIGGALAASEGQP